MQEYRIGRLKGRFVVNVFDDSGARTNRYRLNAGDKSTAERAAPLGAPLMQLREPSPEPV